MSAFGIGFSQELEKLAVNPAVWAQIPAKNLLFHVIFNTKIFGKKIRSLIENVGDDLFATGFRHGLVNKKVKAANPAMMAISSIVGPNPYYVYNSGWNYGKKIHNVMSKIPVIDPKSPYKALRAADIGVTGSLKAAPVTGALAGGAYGYTTGKTKKEPIPVKAILSGMALGAGGGLLAKSYGPALPGPKQLKQIREGIIEPALKGSKSPIGKILDPLAK